MSKKTESKDSARATPNGKASASASPKDDDEEFFTITATGSQDENQFDLIVGCLEELLFDGAIYEAQMRFFERYEGEFDESEENKLSYTRIFNEYIAMLERILTAGIKKKLPNISSKELTKHISDKKDELVPDVFDVMASLGDFLHFKSLILAYKKDKAKKGGDTTSPLAISSIKCQPLILNGHHGS